MKRERKRGKECNRGKERQYIEAKGGRRHTETYRDTQRKRQIEAYRKRYTAR